MIRKLILLTIYTICSILFPMPDQDVQEHQHTEAEPVIENLVESTCKTEGSYDSVVYCSECGEELSRTTETIEFSDHVYNSKGKCIYCKKSRYELPPIVIL